MWITYAKTEIDSTLSDCTTSTQLHTDSHSKSRMNLTLDTYTTTTQLYGDFYSKGYMNQRFLTSTQIVEFHYTDAFLANKISNTGNVSLPGHLGIGTYPYASSRIGYNAEVNGYTGYAELKAASSYDMLLNLQTARTDGGWMYFEINNGDYMQLSRSDDKVNIHKNTATSGNSDVGVGASQTSVKANVNHAGHQGNVQIEARWRSQGCHTS